MEIPPPPEIVQPESAAEKAEHGHSHMSIDFERLDPNTGVIDLESDAIAQNDVMTTVTIEGDASALLASQQANVDAWNSALG